ncbi:hypothetical protein [Tenacibaculum sp. Ill]|uniref:hypothetical protein n=1 Tax=Tenacibaculum sp. Ill TaxID=3445935 RepID=UPI003F7A2485
MKINELPFYKGFLKKELESLPVNYQLLTHFTFEQNVITSENSENSQGIDISLYNGKILTSEKHFSPISKIIDFD